MTLQGSSASITTQSAEAAILDEDERDRAAECLARLLSEFSQDQHGEDHHSVRPGAGHRGLTLVDG
jgi:hypothetical protein